MEERYVGGLGLQCLSANNPPQGTTKNKMNTKHTLRDGDGTAYIREAGGTCVYALEAANGEGWYLERQKVDGDENPERLTWHKSEDDAIAELVSFLS
jgi:hypothetical protein